MNAKGGDNQSIGAFSSTVNDALSFRQVLGEHFEKSASERGLEEGKCVTLYIAVESIDRERIVVKVGKAKLATACEIARKLQRRTHLHQLPNTADQNLVVITSAILEEDKRGLPYPYKFQGSESEPVTLAEISQQGFYAWDTRMMTLSKPSSANLEAKTLPTDPDIAIEFPPDRRLASSPSASLGEQEKSAANEDYVVEHENVEASLDADLESGKDVNIRRYCSDDYEKVEAWVFLDQILEPRTTLRDIDMDWVSKFQKRFAEYSYEYSSGLMTVTVLLSENNGLGDLKFSTLLESCNYQSSSSQENASKCIKRGVLATVVDGLHRLKALKLLRKRQNDFVTPDWLQQPIRMTLQIRSDIKDMSITEILHLGAQRNHLSATVRPFAGVEQYLRAVTSYLTSFADENQLEISEVRPTNIAEELCASKIITDLSFETYRRYSRVAKVFAKYPCALDVLVDLNKDQVIKLGISHLDSTIYHQVDKTGVILVMESVAAYIRKPSANGRFQSLQFFQYVKSAYDVLLHEYNKYCLPKQINLSEFLNVRTQHSSRRQLSIREMFVNNMRLFLPAKKHQQKNLYRINRLASKIENHFKTLREQQESIQISDRIAHQHANVLLKKTQVNRISSENVPNQDDNLLRPREGPCDKSNNQNTTEDALMCSEDSLRTYNKVSNVTLRRSTREKRAPDVIQMECNVFKKPKRLRLKKRSIRSDTSPVLDAIGESLCSVDEEGFRVPTKKLPGDGFDDLVPLRLPGMPNEVDMYSGEIEPAWIQAVSIPPADAEHLLREAKKNKLALHHTPFLNNLHIPRQHRAHLYLTVESILFHHRLAWLMGAKKCRENSFNGESDDSWGITFKRFRRGQGKPYFDKQSLILQERGFCILEGFADPSSVPQEILNQLKPSSEIQLMSIQKLFDHYLSTFPGEDPGEHSEKLHLWNPIVNLGEEDGDKSMRNRGKARYSSTRFLLMEHTEEDPATKWASVRRAMLDAWMGQLAVLLGLENRKSGKTYIPKTGGRFLITGKDCPRQCPHNDFQVPDRTQADRCPGYFMIATGSDCAPIWICEYSHHFVFNPVVELQHLARALKLRMFIIPQNSVLFGHGFVTHAGAGDAERVKDNITTRYHLYLTPETVPLPDSVFFAFGSPLPRFQESLPSRVKLPVERTSTERREEAENGNFDHSSQEQYSSECFESDVDIYPTASEGTERRD